jgi:hypothetical protein
MPIQALLSMYFDDELVQPDHDHDTDTDTPGNTQLQETSQPPPAAPHDHHPAHLVGPGPPIVVPPDHALQLFGHYAE